MSEIIKEDVDHNITVIGAFVTGQSVKDWTHWLQSGLWDSVTQWLEHQTL